MYYQPAEGLTQRDDMCLIVFSYRQHPHFPLLVAANRDEHYARPTAAAQLWQEYPNLLAGRDLEAGGTWLGITRHGRFAAITNHRNPPSTPEQPRSRGLLTLDFLRGDTAPTSYLQQIANRGGDYAGFNLLVGDADELCYYSNIEGSARQLSPGTYGLSNSLLDTPWPKVERSKKGLAALLAEGQPDLQQLQSTVSCREVASDDLLPNTGVGVDFERLLSPQFIISTDYGTRATTCLKVGADSAITFRESRFVAGGKADGHSDFLLQP